MSHIPFGAAGDVYLCAGGSGGRAEGGVVVAQGFLRQAGAAGAEFGGHAFAVGLHGMKGDGEVVRDFFTHQPPTDEGKNFVFPHAQAVARVGVAHVVAAQSFGHQCFEFGGEVVVGLRFVEDGVNVIVETGWADEGARFTREDDDFGSRLDFDKAAGDFCAAAVGEGEVEDEQVRPVKFAGFDAFGDRLGGGHYFEVGHGFHHGVQHLEEHQLILDDDAGEILGGHEPIIYPDCVSLQRFTRTQIGSLYSNILIKKEFRNNFAEKEKEKTPMEVGHLGVASGEREVEAGARGKVEGGLKWVSVGRF